MPMSVRASAETMPCVTLWPTPNGLPMAMTKSPTSSASESPRSSAGNSPGALDLQHGQIGAGVAQHDLGLVFMLVGDRDLHVGHAFDDMVIGDHEAAGVDDHAGAERLRDALLLPLRLAAAAEEMAEERIVHQRVARHRVDARCVDVDDRGPHFGDDGRERQMHLRGVGGNGALVGERGSGEGRAKTATAMRNKEASRNPRGV